MSQARVSIVWTACAGTGLASGSLACLLLRAIGGPGDHQLQHLRQRDHRQRGLRCAVARPIRARRSGPDGAAGADHVRRALGVRRTAPGLRLFVTRSPAAAAPGRAKLTRLLIEAGRALTGTNVSSWAVKRRGPGAARYSPAGDDAFRARTTRPESLTGLWRQGGRPPPGRPRRPRLAQLRHDRHRPAGGLHQPRGSEPTNR